QGQNYLQPQRRSRIPPQTPRPERRDGVDPGRRRAGHRAGQVAALRGPRPGAGRGDESPGRDPPQLCGAHGPHPRTGAVVAGLSAGEGGAGAVSGYDYFLSRGGGGDEWEVGEVEV
ncbi:hypothetical protein V492_05295, partial [Pseudogymnoascus sp. VKM F-4246]